MIQVESHFNRVIDVYLGGLRCVLQSKCVTLVIWQRPSGLTATIDGFYEFLIAFRFHFNSTSTFDAKFNDCITSFAEEDHVDIQAAITAIAK